MRWICIFLMLFILNTSIGQTGKSLTGNENMVAVPGGAYKTFFISKSRKPLKVATFLLDKTAVTNAEFLEFVKATPQWQRSQVSSLLADKNYLHHWKTDLSIGEENKDIWNSPVVNVSWFAAQAYCTWIQKRLPTLAEWELAGNSPPRNIKYKTVSDYILHWYEKPPVPILPNTKSTYVNELGLYDMHGLVWEWTFDFNSFIGSSDSRNTTTDNQGLFCAGAAINVKDRNDYAAFLRYSFRGSLKGNYCINCLGFRCAKNSMKNN